MSFIWPFMLAALVLLPFGVILYLWFQRRRRQIVARYGSLGLVQTGTASGLGWRRHVPAVFFFLGLTALVFALARPQTVVSLPRVEGTVMLVFDVSGSMAAEDFEPTRMEAAKAAATTFVQKQPTTVQIGVVAFSDGGLAVQAPTDDQGAVLAAINRLAPNRATSIGAGLAAALESIYQAEDRSNLQYSDLTPLAPTTPTPVPPGTFAPAVIVLLSDGENNARPDPLQVAQAAADYGVRIYTIGVGSARGTELTVNGFTVFTQLNEELLQQVATVTQGQYYNAADAEQLEAIYNGLRPQLVLRDESLEVTALLAGVGIAMFLVGGGLSLWWFSRLP